MLNCTKFQPIIETAFHDGVCTEAVAGLYYIWQVVAAAAVFTYVGIWLVPFATAAFKQEGGGVVGVADTDPEKGIFGDQSEYDETGKLMEAAAVAWTCQQLGVPFVALKGITDLVDGAHATRGEFESNLATAAASLQAKLAAVLRLLEGEPLNRWGE